MTDVLNIAEPSVPYEVKSATLAGFIPRSVSNGDNAVDCEDEDVIYAIVGVKVTSSATAQLIPTSISGQITNNDDGEWFLLRNPTLSSPLTYNAVAGEIYSVALGDTVNTVTEDATTKRLFGGQLEGNTHFDPSKLDIADTITGDTDVYVLCFRGYTDDALVHGTINFGVKS